ncbi:hypothetical protein B0H13DRAFT_2128227, partial [Mycena leptocephala]
GNINVFFLVYASMLLVPRTGLTEWSFEMLVFPAFRCISAGIPVYALPIFSPSHAYPSSNSDSSCHWGDHRGNDSMA